MEAVALETFDLTKKYRQLTAVSGLSFQIHEKDIFGLLGPNGAGKSTLMKMLTTIQPPTFGDALICRTSITNDAQLVRELIGYVPQLISADGTLTGYENLLLFAKLYKIPRKIRNKRIIESLETMGLSSVADKVVREYSGGMIRRLEIIQAILHKPKVLFLDEPTTGLDPVARKVVWDHLQKIHKRDGITIVVTTHDMAEADFLCNRIAIMLHGKIAAIGTKEKLKKEVGPQASLHDVFIKYAGKSIEAENAYKEIVNRRRTENRRG